MEFEKIRDIIADVMDMELDEITEASKFIDDLGCDSLDVQQILLEVQSAFSIQIPDAALDGLVTVGDVVKQLKNL